MIKSMTGYGKGESILTSGSKVLVEIKTTNHRYRDLCIRCPRSLSSLENEIKKYLYSKIQRGRIDLLIQIMDGITEATEIKLNLPMVDKVYNLIENLKHRLYLKGDITLDTLLHFREIFLFSESGEETGCSWNELKLAMDAALENLKEMREKEGGVLLKDIESRLETIGSILDTIEARALTARSQYHAILKKRLQELLSDIRIDETRLAQEVAFLVERTDITEEIIRVKSHLNRLKEWLYAEEPVGKRIEFLLQEINREVTTMGAKVQDADNTCLTIEIKNELEKIREQIQNVE